MPHLFVSPHPDDAALSCGGLIRVLADAGEQVDIVAVFSGAGRLDRLSPYQRLALGFGSQDRWSPGSDGATNPEPTTEREPTAPSASSGGLVSMADPGPWAQSADDDWHPPTPAEVMSVRREEDWAYARAVGASLIHLDLQDAVFRAYTNDEQLMGEPRSDDPEPTEELRKVILDRRPDVVYLPLAVGGHVDHRLARRAGTMLLTNTIAADAIRFYEDFPYAANLAFESLDSLDAEFARSLPAGWTAAAELVAIGAVLERKIAGLEVYRSQLGRLFGGSGSMATAVRARAETVGRAGDTGPAERYWRLVRS